MCLYIYICLYLDVCKQFNIYIYIYIHFEQTICLNNIVKLGIIYSS